MTDKQLLKQALEALEKTYELAVDADDEQPVDWALLCEFLYQQIATLCKGVRARLEQPEQEPVECMCGICKLGERPWAGLTEEEIVSINDQHYNIAFRDFDADVAIARAIEAKLKEKNTP
jgi:hypothetical protein